MTVQVVFGTSSNALVECAYECGNTTHSAIGICGECLDEQSFITTRNIREHALARRFLVKGY